MAHRTCISRLPVLAVAGLVTLALGAGLASDRCAPPDAHARKRPPRLGFDFGVAAGEVTPTSALLWAHTGRPTRLKVTVEERDTKRNRQTHKARTTAASGASAHVAITGLTPGTAYRYTFTIPSTKETLSGLFRTAAAEGEPVTFAISADVAAARAGRFDIFNAITDARPDFYVHLGDWPYADRAESLKEYREQHQRHRAAPQAIDLLRSVGVYATFDDHEVFNDWDEGYRKEHPDSVRAGLRAWAEWFPVHPRKRGTPTRYYRRWRWSDLEFFLLDTRSYRDPKTDRDRLDASGKPRKSMLGATQRAWLLDGLARSTATFKIILSSVPLDFGTTGLDHWAGYAAERDLIVGTLRALNLSGVVVLSADQHWFSANHHNGGLKEFQFGPLTANLRRPGSPQAHTRAIASAYNFGLLRYDPAKRALRVEARDHLGALLYTETLTPEHAPLTVTSTPPGSAFTLCPRDAAASAPCAHTFTGITPATFDRAPTGPYVVRWHPRPGYTTAPDQRLRHTAQTPATADAQLTRSPLALPLTETFDAPPQRPWTFLDATDRQGPARWSFEDGCLIETSGAYDARLPSKLPHTTVGTSAITGDPDWTDVHITARFLTPDDDTVGLIARYQDPDNYYLLTLDRQRTAARLIARVNGTPHLLAEDRRAPAYPQRAWNTLTLTARGDRLSATLNDRPLLSATDSRLTSGAVGLHARANAQLRFDDLTVTRATAPQR